MTAPSNLRTVRTQHPGPPPGGDYATAGQWAMLLDWLTPMHPPAGATPAEPRVYATAGPGGRDLVGYLHRRSDASERRPGIVFVHGGGWAGAGPGLHIRHAHQWAERGFVTFNVTYRLTGEAPWPAAIDDVMAALRWFRTNADDLGLDPTRVAVAGGSAGGHLAAMAALLGADDPSAAVEAAVLWYPAVDLRELAARPDTRPMIDALLPGAPIDELVAASPVGNVHAAAPAFLTMTGDADPVTTLADIDRFHACLTQHGVRNELDVFEGRDHGFDYHPADWSTCFQRMSAFLDDLLDPHR